MTTEDAVDEPLLRLSDVTHRYGDRDVLRSVSLHLRPGECVALLGDNGSGKSTLLRVACGRERPAGGSVHFAGRPVDEDDPATRGRIATAMDTGAFYPDLTVREHLTLVALAHGLGPAADEAVERALYDHGLADRHDRLPAALSSGQTQALLLAAVFVRPYELLVLDEPEQRLDAGARQALTERLASHKRRGAAVLLATHHRPLADALADRTVVLVDGRAAADHPAADRAATGACARD